MYLFCDSFAPRFRQQEAKGKMSAVWQYFEKVEENGAKKARCKTCKKCLGYNTTGLKSHLESQHQIVCQSQGDQTQQITAFFTTEKRDSLSSIVAKLCAQDGMSFSMVANSKVLRKAIPKLGLGDLPSSSNTIRDLVLKHADEVKMIYKHQIKQSKDEQSFFSISFDEWTSTKKRRYMSVILHSSSTFWNLGLIRIEGKTNYLLSSDDIDHRLQDFNLDLSSIICLLSDGASINLAIARHIDIYIKICLAHGIHLAIISVLYSNSQSCCSESEDENDSEEDILSENVEIDEPIETQHIKRRIQDDFFQLVELKKRKNSGVASLESTLAGEMSAYERTGQKGPILQNTLLVTKTIRPTTTDCERVFSLAGNFCNKLRTKLSDNALNCLCFLKSHF